MNEGTDESAQVDAQTRPQAVSEQSHAHGEQAIALGEPVRAGVENSGSLSELESLIGELKDQVGALREGELDAASLERRLGELNELATRAASVLDAATR